MYSGGERYADIFSYISRNEDNKSILCVWDASPLLLFVWVWAISNLGLLTRKLFILEWRLIAPYEDLIGSY
jgi:hypothetical protein